MCSLGFQRLDNFFGDKKYCKFYKGYIVQSNPVYVISIIGLLKLPE